MTNKKLTQKDYGDAALQLSCEPAALEAVAFVESPGSGYDKKGRLLLRFEGHKFREFTGGKYDRTHPDISYPFKVEGEKKHGYAEFNKAFKLNSHAALKATSWGRFQIMGFNYDKVGFKSVEEMVDFLRESEKNQLAVFVRTIRAFGLTNEIRNLDFAGFARGYNGKSYRKFKYDSKMKAAYDRLKKLESSRKSQGEDGTVETVEPAETVTTAETTEVTSTVEKGDTTVETKVTQETSTATDFKARIPSIDTAKKYLTRIFGGTFLTAALAWWKGLPIEIAYTLLFIAGITVGALGVLFVMYYKEVFRYAAKAMEIRANPNLGNPILTTDKEGK